MAYSCMHTAAYHKKTISTVNIRQIKWYVGSSQKIVLNL